MFNQNCNEMKKLELIKAVCAKVGGISQEQAGKVIDALGEVVIENVRDNEDTVTLTNLGTFKVKKVKEHDGRNPLNGQTIHIPASKNIQFKPLTTIKKVEE